MVKERTRQELEIKTFYPEGDSKPRQIAVPKIRAATPAEIERRRRIFEEVDALQAQVKPPTPGNTMEDYIRQMREED